MMNKKRILAVLAALSLSLSFAGCQKVASEENKNNTSQEESVEKSEDTKEESAEDKTDENSSVSVIYSYDIDKDELVANKVELKDPTPENIFAELQKLGVITESAKLNSYNVEKADGLQTGFMDVSSDFVNTNLGSTAESLMLDAVVKTMVENTDVEQILLTVDGGDYESGHIHLGAGDFLTVKDKDDTPSEEDSSSNSSSNEQSDEEDTVE